MPRQVEPPVSTVCGTAKPISTVAVLSCAWPALLLATVCLVPYLNKAFVVDDPYFLTLARQIVKHPAHPMDFEICWNNMLGCTNMNQYASGNVLMGQVAQGYLLVPTVLGGAHEWIAHLTQLVIAWIAVVAMTSLTFRFGWDRWHATVGALLLVAIPPFLPMASTAMPDILATALTLVAMERLAAWRAEQKWGQGAAASIALGLAALARPHLILLLGLGAFFLLDGVKPREVLVQFRRKFWLWTPIVAGCGLLLAVILAVREDIRAISAPPVASGARYIRDNLFTYLLYFAFPLPLAACWVANRLNARRWLFVSILFAVAVIPKLLGLRWDLSLMLFLAVVSFGALADLFFEAAKGCDLTGLFLMLWILIPLPVVYYVHLPIKYVLPCMPAVILLCFRLLDDVSKRFARFAVVIVIVACTSYSFLILRSDAEYANFGREALNELITPHVAAGESVWYPEQCCSYWYAALDGARLTYPGGPQPMPGDLLVMDRLILEDDPRLERFPHRTLVGTTFHTYRFGRTVGLRLGGLYTGFWLWGFGDAENDRFELWRID
ncbi:hypothetical protein P8935_20545 [Telmatobacter sp. DSM 110680]|uniref:Glycosyltransferase RgtA/B/C/D-like domain-containing protein n=1 Tax=Telmatobacter sp. DSM 110680 TaxID=3036704 RepID=A0AAU7DJL2_9BACT